MCKILLYLLSLLLTGTMQAAAQESETKQLQNDIKKLQDQLSQYRAQTPYIVIDTVHNQLQIRQDNQIVHQATCATGSGKVLLHPGKSARWQFDTPIGLRTIQKKVKDPIWAKPIWAFVENGEQPSVLAWDFRRLDLTTLGAYALELGDDYEIHGTLYPSLLGRNITHGCIRLNDEDLALTHRTMQVGDRVYIY